MIEAIGPDVTGFTLGERVAYASACRKARMRSRIVPAARLIALPDRIDDRTAAAMMIRGMTARHAAAPGLYRTARRHRS